MNIVVVFIILIILLFVVQIILEIGSAKNSDLNLSRNNILKKLEDNAVSVNERLGLLVKHADDETMNNINLETNIKVKVSGDLLVKIFNEVRDIKKTLEKNNNVILEKITFLENNVLDNNKNLEKNVEQVDKPEKNKEIKLEEIKEKIDKLKEDLNIKNPEDQEW